MAAVGAGAVAVTADKAEAGTINYSGPVSVNIGWFGADGTSGHTFTLLGTAARFRLSRSSVHYGFPGSSSATRRINVYGSGGLRLGKAGPLLKVVGAGVTWAAVSASTAAHSLGGRYWYVSVSSTSHHLIGHAPFTNQYLLFRTSAANYGWVELSYDVTDAFGSAPALGPKVTIEGYAYDTSGAIIAAGDTGAAVPEPSTLAETGLAALVLGAAAWRRRKGTRLG